MALGQSYDCPSASETTLKDMGKYHYCGSTSGDFNKTLITKTNQSETKRNHVHILWDIYRQVSNISRTLAGN